MSKTKILYSIIGLLVVLNSSILVVLLTNPHPPRPVNWDKNNPKEIIISKLHLDENQQVQFEKSIKKHHATIQMLDQKLISIRQKMNLLLTQNKLDTVQNNNLMQQFLLVQAQVEVTHRQHFTEIKHLCRPDQLEDFKILMQNIAQLFSKKDQPPHPPRHD